MKAPIKKALTYIKGRTEGLSFMIPLNTSVRVIPKTPPAKNGF